MLSENKPISFLTPLKLIPVLPPTEASTIDNRVVGILINFSPLLNVDEAIPPMSVTIPPPKFIRQEWRVAPLVDNSSQMKLKVLRFLLLSPGSIIMC